MRASLPLVLSEVPGFGAIVRGLFENAPGKLVACLDARTYGVEPPEAANHFLETIKRDNPKLERSAFVVDPAQRIVALQLERMIREAGNPNRRLFTDLDEAKAFLAPVLELEERTRLDAFLASGGEVPGI
ncbi:MAG TPA: hypothetical protein VF407_13660 [Polyangiaceae bacterium]